MPDESKPEPSTIESTCLTGAVDGDLSSTASAPAFRSLAAGEHGPASPSSLPAARRLGDFELLRILGAGSFAQVYLARQISLNREVALKVSANQGGEARTLARLEHDHIVQVFSEVVDEQHNLRILCMQYVPGTTLERVIRALAGQDPRQWSGRAVLDAIDALGNQPAAFDPAALRDRDVLAGSDWVEAVCWLGARLAEAVAYAHSRGVLHRDIKPANILLNRYGRPLLADFNIALDPREDEAGRGEVFGGTLPYMAPEHLDAFNRSTGTPPTVVDCRSDIYALGVVLFELLTGKRPFGEPARATSIGEALREMAAERGAGAPSPRRERPEVPEVLDRVVRRCLQPDPDQRYQRAAELARALEGCRQWQRAHKDLPAPGPVTHAALAHPFAWLLGLSFLPHVLGSVVNITYNRLRIVEGLSAAQKGAFVHLVTGYNAIIYLAAVGIFCRLLIPLYRTWRQLDRGELVDAAELAAARRQALALPLWVIAVSCAGWLPGGLLFPLGISLAAGPLPAEEFGHFLISFTVSGLIALAYSFFAAQYVVLRVFYPRLWADAQDVRATADAELGRVDRRVSLFQLLAGLIPLAGAVLMVVAEPDASGPARGRTFRLLVTTLICLGMAGVGLTLLAGARIGQCLAAFTGGERRARGGA